MDPTVQHPIDPGPTGPTRTVTRHGGPGDAPAGLAWTPLRSGLALVEASRMAGSGRLVFSGPPADALADHARLALALLRARAIDLRLAAAVFDAVDVHLHVQAQAGIAMHERPAMGLALFVALASLVSSTPARHNMAMAGVISQRGLLLPVEDLPDKLHTAQRAAVHTLLLPQRNRREVEALSPTVRAGLRFAWLTTVDDALRAALRPPDPPAVREPGET